ncbi:MAG: sterol desaturase family protein [Pseudomonadota bacterium]
MDWLIASVSELELYNLETALSEWFFVISLAFLGLEFVRYAWRRTLNWRLFGDTVANFAVQALYLVVSVVLFFTFYVSTLSFFHQFAFFDIPTNGWSLVGLLFIADFAYYWEHRFSHRVALAWATHSVHHSSPHYNMSVAYRFGPMDAFWPVFFHVPIVLMGFDPFAVIFAEAVVLLYQTWLHTEAIGKLPKAIEMVFNTPSHHRVHHGRNPEYLDKNYGGVLIVWDRMFGSFAEEEDKVDFGITRPINSMNPMVIFVSGFSRLWREFQRAKGMMARLSVLYLPPGSGDSGGGTQTR